MGNYRPQKTGCTEGSERSRIKSLREDTPIRGGVATKNPEKGALLRQKGLHEGVLVSREITSEKKGARSQQARGEKVAVGSVDYRGGTEHHRTSEVFGPAQLGGREDQGGLSSSERSSTRHGAMTFWFHTFAGCWREGECRLKLLWGSNFETNRKEKTAGMGAERTQKYVPDKVWIRGGTWGKMAPDKWLTWRAKVEREEHTNCDTRRTKVTACLEGARSSIPG